MYSKTTEVKDYLNKKQNKQILITINLKIRLYTTAYMCTPLSVCVHYCVSVYTTASLCTPLSVCVHY